MRMHTRNWKESQLTDLRRLVSAYSVIAVADIDRFPADLFQQVRKKLSGKAVVKVAKVRVLKKALGSEGGSVKIEYKEKSGYEEERTFPRSADPRESKG